MEVKASGEYTLLHANSVDRTTRYYLLQSSTAAAPPKPADGTAIGSDWSETEPNYPSDPGMSLYFVDQTIMSDGTIKYSEVSKSSSYEAASKANAAAEEAKKDASDAAKTATNYIGGGADGLTIGNLTEDELRQNVHISNDSVNIRNGTTVLARFAEKLIELGKASQDATIDLLNGYATISTKRLEDNDRFYTTQITGKQTLELLTGDYASGNFAYLDVENRYEEYFPARINMHVGNKEDDGTVSNGIFALDPDSFEIELIYHSNSSRLIMGADGNRLSSYNKVSGTASIETVSNGSQIQINNRVIGPSGDTLLEQWDDRLRFSFNDKLLASYQGTTPVLASCMVYPNAADTVELSPPVSQQPHGIVLEFAPYVDKEAAGYGLATFFVPKARATGASLCFMIGGSSFNTPCCKWLYIHDTKIVGNDVNNQKGTNNGVTYNNASYVLTKVYGV